MKPITLALISHYLHVRQLGRDYHPPTTRGQVEWIVRRFTVGGRAFTEFLLATEGRIQP